MIRTVIAVAALRASIQAAVPQNLDVIKARKQTNETGPAAGTVAKTLKGEAPFNLAGAKASLRTIVDAFAKMTALFPDDSKTEDGARAQPEFWENRPDLVARYAKLGQDATRALAAIKDQQVSARACPPFL